MLSSTKGLIKRKVYRRNDNFFVCVGDTWKVNKQIKKQKLCQATSAARTNTLKLNQNHEISSFV